MSSGSQPNAETRTGWRLPSIKPLRRAARHEIPIRALIVANNYLESEVSELMKAVSHA